jgi:hypothetical protein
MNLPELARLAKRPGIIASELRPDSLTVVTEMFDAFTTRGNERNWTIRARVTIGFGRDYLERVQRDAGCLDAFLAEIGAEATFLPPVLVDDDELAGVLNAFRRDFSLEAAE